MAYSSRTYTPGSSTTTFALTTSDGDPIGYIKESDIEVKVNASVQAANTYSFSGTKTVEQPSGGNIVLNSGVTGTVILSRTTAIQDATVVYRAGSTLTSSDLNNADNQIRFGLQEFSDDYASLLGTGGNLTNLASFIGGSDTWVSNDAKAATTSAIDGRIDTKATAKVKDDIIATAPVSIADDSPSSGKITISVDAELTELATMSTGTAQALADLTGTEVQILDGATLTTTELNYVDGVTSAVQTQLDAKQPLDADLTAIGGLAKADGNIIVGDGSTWVAENGATARTSLGAQAAAADLTTLSSMQSGAAAELASLTSTELDILDGATLTTTELNYVDGVTSPVQTQVDGKQASNARLSTLSGMHADTASTLAATASDDGGLDATIDELNQLDGITLADTASLDTTSDVKIPTSKAIATHVNNVVNALGGFVAINGPTNFPDPQPAQGVVVSIKDVGSGFTTSSNEITITNGAGTNKNVRITGFPSEYAAATLTDDTGLQVTSDITNSDTSSTPQVHRYVYHKQLAKESDVKALSGDIDKFNERYRVTEVGASLPNVADSANDDGDLIWHTDGSKMYVYNGAYSGGNLDRANSTWDQVQSIGDFKFLVLTNAGTSNAATYNGSTATFDLKETSVSGSAAGVTSAFQLMVSVNGVIQKPNAGANPSGLDGFVMGDGSNNASTSKITFCAGPPSNADVFVIQSGSAVTINSPANNTVATDTLQAGSVTNDKVNANAAIAGSKLADDSIAEVKLDILNAPSGTDKFLGYTSNGMEWAVPADATKLPLTGGTITGDVTFDNGTNAGNDLTWDESDNALEFNDNVKAIFGSSSDGLEIYHNGSHSYIDDSGTGRLYIRGNDEVRINKYTGEYMVRAVADAQVDLYYDNTREFGTVSGGVKLYGHSASVVTALTSAASLTIDFSLSNHFSCTMGHNITFNNPTTESIGQSGTITLTQDGTGSRTASWGNQFLWTEGTAPTLSTAANAVDRIDYVVVATDKIHCVASLAIA